MRKTAAAAAIASEPTEAEIAASNNQDAMQNAFATLMQKGFAPPPTKAERKAREKKVAKLVDGRKLRAKGRTVQTNFKTKPHIREALDAKIAAEGITIADFMERILEEALGLRSN